MPNNDKLYSVDITGTRLMCARCGEYKAPQHFTRDTGRARGYIVYCKPCAKERRVERTEITKTQERVYRLKKYGITLKEFNDKLALQNNKCAICKNELNTESLNMNSQVADHCHEKSVFRGILCKRCNLLLGHAKDSITILQGAIEYLKKFK